MCFHSPILFFLVIISTLVHLVLCLCEKRILQFPSLKKATDFTKPIPMFLLFIYSLSIYLNNKNSSISTSTFSLTEIFIFLFAAQLFGMIGDIFLIDGKKKKRFILGSSSFFIGHIFYLLVFAPAIKELPLWSCFIALIVTIILIIPTWIISGKQKGLTGITIILYTSILCLLIFSGISGVIINYSKGSIYVLIGAVLFTISDCFVSMSIFNKNFYPLRFIFMTLYLTAEFFLTAGVLIPYL